MVIWLRVGVIIGEVFVGLFWVGGDYMVFGDVVNFVSWL